MLSTGHGKVAKTLSLPSEAHMPHSLLLHVTQKNILSKNLQSTIDVKQFFKSISIKNVEMRNKLIHVFLGNIMPCTDIIST